MDRGHAAVVEETAVRAEAASGALDVTTPTASPRMPTEIRAHTTHVVTRPPAVLACIIDCRWCVWRWHSGWRKSSGIWWRRGRWRWDGEPEDTTV